MKVFKKTLIFNLILILLVCITCLLIGEISTRLYLVFLGKGGYIWLADYYLGKIHAPNSRFVYKEDFSQEFLIKRKTNSLGLIGEEISVKKPKNAFRILMLGDSFTEALQVEEGKNFCEQLQYLLNDNRASKNRYYQLINAGVAGYSPISEYLYFKRELIKLNPDLVILQLFANDIFEDNKIVKASLVAKDGFVSKINRYFIKSYLENPTIANRALKLQDYLYKFENYILKKSKFFQLIVRLRSKFYKNTQTHKYMNSLPEFNDANQFFIIQDKNPLFKDEDFRVKTWQNSRKYILAIRELAEKNNANFLIFLIPPEAQFNLKSYGLNTHLYFSQAPNFYLNELLEEFCKKENINYLDLLSIFRENKNKGLYFGRDGHLTKQGNELVAQAIFDFLTKQNLVP